jgi:hypothetical protein
MLNKNSLDNKKSFLFLLSLVAVPIIIYLFFLRWRTNVIYGDDLYVFTNHETLKTFVEKINMAVSAGKYRPVSDFVLHYVIEILQKNVTAYYLFNVFIQTINTFLFAAIAYIFSQSRYLSLLFALLIGLSRFAFYNLTQLLLGGALEALAMTFFLASLYFILKPLVNKNLTQSQKLKSIIWSIVFANLDMYTHERYIVLIPFICIVILFSPDLEIVPTKQKKAIGLLLLVSVILNVVLKKYVYNMPFFVGTGGTHITFSFSSAATFFKDAVLSILQINSGGNYLIGIEFLRLPIFDILLVLVSVSCMLLIMVPYLSYLWKIISLKQKEKYSDLSIFLFLILIFGFALVPAIVTIRLEQRWLQASYSIFILLIVIAASRIQFKDNKKKGFSLILFVAIFLWADSVYLHIGSQNIYMSYSEKIAEDFKKGVDDNVIHPNSTRLFIWQNKIDSNTIGELNWVLAQGYFFNFYHGKRKSIIYVDSVYEKNKAGINQLQNFNKQNDQLLYIDNGIIDITDDYLKDSLKHIGASTFLPRLQYDQNKLVVNNDDFYKFSTSGFYDNENGIRWTNGNAVINLLGNFITRDSLAVELDTYMPPICKDVIPALSLTDDSNNIYQPIYTKRKDDKFFFKFYFKQKVNIQQINILSKTVDTPSDKRILSFPFISLQLTH